MTVLYKSKISIKPIDHHRYAQDYITRLLCNVKAPQISAPPPSPPEPAHIRQR